MIAALGLIAAGILVELGVAVANAQHVSADQLGLIGPIALYGGWFLIGAGVVWVARIAIGQALRRSPRITVRPFVAVKTLPGPGVVRQRVPAPSPPSRSIVDSRVFVTETPEDLLAFFKDHTSSQASKLVQPWLGKWMKVSGRIRNVTEFLPFAQLTFETRPCYLYFTDKVRWGDGLEMLKRGDTITAQGRIDAINDTWVDLHDCELVDSPRAQAAPGREESPPILVRNVEYVTSAPQTRLVQSEFADNLGKHEVSEGLVTPPISESPAATGTRSRTRATGSTRTKPGETPDRVFVPSSVTPQYLTGLFVGTTDAQGQRRAAPYVGRWMPAQGPVRNVHLAGKEVGVTSLVDAAATGASSIIIMMWFTGTSADHAELLNPGDRIAAIGCIEKVDRDSLVLNRCELAPEG